VEDCQWQCLLTVCVVHGIIWATLMDGDGVGPFFKPHIASWEMCNDKKMYKYTVYVEEVIPFLQLTVSICWAVGTCQLVQHSLGW